MDKLYYEIASARWRVEGTAAEHIRQLPAFAAFESGGAETADYVWRMEGNDRETELTDCLYESGFGGMECRFGRMEGGYAVRMTAPEVKTVLRYREGSPEVWINTGISPSLLHFVLWLAFGLQTAGTGRVAVHASAICYRGRALLFLGESGTGKSTHTRLWREHIPGSELLNDDSPIVYVRDGETVACGSPWSGKTPCYRNTAVPLAAVVRLSQGPRNRLRRLSALEGIGALYPSCPPAFARDAKLSGMMCAALSGILTQVPAYALECLPDAEAARLVCKTVFPGESC